MYLYTDEQLKTMPVSDLSALCDAAWRIADAMANYRDKHWNDTTQSVTNDFHTEYWRLYDILIDRLVANDRFWREFGKGLAEYHHDLMWDMVNLWDSLARIAEMYDPEIGPTASWNAEHYVEDLIWQVSDSPRDHIMGFKGALCRKKSNTAKVQFCRKWASADWSFGIPDFKK